MQRYSPIRKKWKKMASKYWQERLQDSIYKKSVGEMKKKLVKVYRDAEQTVSIQLNDTLMEILSKGEEVTANTLYQHNRYKKLQDLINEQIIKIGKAEEKAVTKTLLSTYKKVYTETAKKYTTDFTWTILNEQMAKEIVFANFKGANFSSRIWDNKSKLRAQIEKSVIDSVVVGNSKDRAVKEIRQRFGVGFNDADRIVRTETQRVLNDGQRQTYKDRGYTQVKWLTVNDDRYCDECMDMDGHIFEIDNAPSVVHPNCRCTFIPVLDESLFK